MLLRVLFVCYENICRSPMAEGIFSALVRRDARAEGIVVESAGTVCYQKGSLPDSRAVMVAGRYGIDISPLRARCIDELDLGLFDWIFTMDAENYQDVSSCFAGAGPVYMMTHFDPYAACQDIADPYYGSEDDFLRVYKQLDRAIGYAYRQILGGLHSSESSDINGFS